MATVLVLLFCAAYVLLKGQEKRELYRRDGVQVTATVVTKYTEDDNLRGSDMKEVEVELKKQ